MSYTSKFETNLNGIPVVFNTSGEREWRRMEQYSWPVKEPETYEWIDTFIKEKDVFFDIGANTGGFSLYAARKLKELTVLCFDPDVQNIAAINKNIFLNNVSNKVKAYCLGISSKNELGNLSIFDISVLFSAGHAKSAMFSSKHRSAKNPQTMIGTLALSIDSLIKDFNCPFPNHIKIDVDGYEDHVINGAVETLKDIRLKSLSVEHDYSNVELVSKIKEFGFKEYTEIKNPLYHQMEETKHIPAGMGNKLFYR